VPHDWRENSRPSLRAAVNPVPEKVLVRALILTAMAEPKLLCFLNRYRVCLRQTMHTYADLAEKLGMGVHELPAPARMPSRAWPSCPGTVL
jgi:hypothetical protein